jgi:hypothetical protein
MAGGGAGDTGPGSGLVDEFPDAWVLPVTGMPWGMGGSIDEIIEGLWGCVAGVGAPRCAGGPDRFNGHPASGVAPQRGYVTNSCKIIAQEPSEPLLPVVLIRVLSCGTWDPPQVTIDPGIRV